MTFQIQFAAMRFTLVFILVSISFSSYSQRVFGTVTDEKGEPLSFATVYLANTDLGTISDVDGNFNISNIPVGKYDLVASFVGYQTGLISIQIEEGGELERNLVLKESSFLLEEIEVVEDLKLRKHFLRTFKDHFIGESEFASSCKILNEDVIFFRKNEQDGIFEAFAEEPIAVENKSLGYRVFYDLYQFRIDEKEGILTMFGIPRFEDLNKKTKNKVMRNRERAYGGSLLHFFRTLYRDKDLAKFRVWELHRLKEERERIVKIFNPQGAEESISEPYVETRDSVGRELKYSDFVFFDQFGRCFFKGDQYLISSLYPPLRGYAPDYSGVKRNPNTKLFILKNQLQVFPNGRVDDATKIYVEGYWTWSEKIANIIPANYNLE